MSTLTQDRFLRLEQIVPSELQPRKHFAPEGIAELVQSFREHGFDDGLSRLLVRPVNRVQVSHDEVSTLWFIQESRNGEWDTVATADSAEEATTKAEAARRFEIVAGERRWRAAGEMGLKEVPVAVREMADLEVLEKQLVENIDREDLTAMEEAAAFKRLMDMGRSMQEVADRVGKSLAWVSDRLVLNRVNGTPIANAVEQKQISPAHAREIARVPARNLQLELLEKVLHPPDGSEAPWNRDALHEHIALNYQRDLREATFDKTDETLVPRVYDVGSHLAPLPEGEAEKDPAFAALGEAERNGRRLWGGSCLDCPMNKLPEGSSNRRGNIGFCTHLECFQLKTIESYHRWAVVEVRIKKEEGRSVVTLSHAENEALWDESGIALAHDSEFVEFNDPPRAAELRSDTMHNWKSLTKDQPVEVVLGRDAAGGVHELVRHDQAKKAAHLNGHLIFRDSERENRLDKERSSTALPAAPQSDGERAAETLAKAETLKADTVVKHAERAAIVAACQGCVRRGMLQLPKEFWGAMAAGLLDAAASAKLMDEVAGRYEFELDGESIKRLTLGERLGLVVECLAVLTGETEVWANLFGVDLKKARKAACCAKNTP
jgi:ParB/RepB/Spo0J family partition protein